MEFKVDTSKTAWLLCFASCVCKNIEKNRLHCKTVEFDSQAVGQGEAVSPQWFLALGEFVSEACFFLGLVPFLDWTKVNAFVVQLPAAVNSLQMVIKSSR